MPRIIALPVLVHERPGMRAEWDRLVGRVLAELTDDEKARFAEIAVALGRRLPGTETLSFDDYGEDGAYATLDGKPDPFRPWAPVFPGGRVYDPQLGRWAMDPL